MVGEPAPCQPHLPTPCSYLQPSWAEQQWPRGLGARLEMGAELLRVSAFRVEPGMFSGAARRMRFNLGPNSTSRICCSQRRWRRFSWASAVEASEVGAVRIQPLPPRCGRGEVGFQGSLELKHKAAPAMGRLQCFRQGPGSSTMPAPGASDQTGGGFIDWQATPRTPPDARYRGCGR